jgi:hypothetical protein
MSLLVGITALVGAAGCINAGAAGREREIQRSFTAAPGSTVVVEISGGSIVSRTTSGRTVNVTLRETVAANSDREADELLGRYDVTIAQEGDRIVVRATRRQDITGLWRGVGFASDIEVPADVHLDVRTSGGRISIVGERTASLQARTSGGSVRADGGAGDLDLRTSGGSIEVDRALGRLAAQTSGGSIRVNRIGAASRDVSLRTSGGSIRAGIDPAAAFDVSAETSGGSVHVDDLPVMNAEPVGRGGRSRFHGTMNGGGGHFVARTSGGSIRLAGTARP